MPYLRRRTVAYRRRAPIRRAPIRRRILIRRAPVRRVTRRYRR